MIWFACKKCNKRLSRPESQSGAMIFCDCGQSQLVPWSSTAPEGPSAPPAMPRPSVPVPPARSVPPARPSRPVPRRDSRDDPPLEIPDAARSLDLPGPARKPTILFGKVNPNYCFQHDEARSEVTCALCSLPFCKNCVVTLRGETVCGACKNFQLASLGRPLRVHPGARLALGVALAGGPAAFLLSLTGVGLAIGEGLMGVAAALCLVAAVLPVLGISLSARALRGMEAKQEGGHGLAAGGLCVGLMALFWCLGAFAVIAGRAFQ